MMQITYTRSYRVAAIARFVNKFTFNSIYSANKIEYKPDQIYMAKYDLYGTKYRNFYA